jgi:amidase
VYALSSETPPAYEVEVGETFVVQTQDAMDGQIPAEGRCVAEVDDSRANPMTGPIRVRGAKRGQTLAIHLLNIAVDEQGWMSRSPSGLVNPVKDNLVQFVPDVQLPVCPMIGVLGLAPAEGSYTGKDVTMGGGNFDIKEFAAGTTVFMPVQVDGANVVVGDVHALQADGESSGTGVEIGADVSLRVEVLDEGLVDAPYFYRQGILSTVGVAPDLTRACEMAVGNLARIVSEASGWERDRSWMFLSLMADVHVGQFVCPIKSAYASLDLCSVPWPIHVGV